MSNQSDSTYIAMWSGPRNISTAMMRAWENRADTIVCDEPFYAHYLAHTGLRHPLYEQVIAGGETDWRRVAQRLLAPLPTGKSIYYQKHMSHHLLPHMQGDWIEGLTHCFLIRDPREVLLSYREKRADVSADDLGFPQQAALFEQLRRSGQPTPIVIDAADFLRAPEPLLRQWCHRLGVDFRAEMLRWRAGPRASDGVWAAHWYANVWNSTGFAAYERRAGEVPVALAPVVAECQPYYELLHAHRLKI